MPANAGLCDGRATLLASRLLILRLTSRKPAWNGHIIAISISQSLRQRRWRARGEEEWHMEQGRLGGRHK